jgi:hypothetical protein
MTSVSADQVKLILSKCGLEEDLRQGTIDFAEDTANEQDELRAKIMRFEARSGWLCFTDEVKLCVGPLSNTDLDNRIVLYGELVKDNVSLHIRQSETGWSLWTLSKGDSAEDILVCESFRSTKYADDQRSEQLLLVYETCWKLRGFDEMKSYQPLVSRFVGFRDTKEVQRAKG